MPSSYMDWSERRQRLQEVARRLTAEFQGNGRVRYVVTAHGAQRLELVVRPESGIDTFDEFIESEHDLDRATDEFRHVVGLYEAGRRPPFE